MPAHFVRTPEHARGHLDVAAGEGAADGRAADRLLDTVDALDQVHRLEHEVVGATELAEQADVPLPVAAEVEVLADDDDLDGEVGDQHPLDERLRRLLRLGLVEVQHHGCVHAAGLEQLEPLLGAGQQLGSGLGPHDLGRMAIERQHHRERLLPLGEVLDLIDDGHVADVHTVIGADRDDGSLTRPRRPIEIGDDLHGLRR